MLSLWQRLNFFLNYTNGINWVNFKLKKKLQLPKTHFPRPLLKSFSLKNVQQVVAFFGPFSANLKVTNIFEKSSNLNKSRKNKRHLQNKRPNKEVDFSVYNHYHFLFTVGPTKLSRRKTTRIVKYSDKKYSVHCTLTHVTLSIGGLISSPTTSITIKIDSMSSFYFTVSWVPP